MEEYNLTGGSSWELLEERRDQLDTIIGEIDNLDLDQLEVECDSCAGEGEVTDDCPECGGDGLDLDSKEEKPCGVCKGEGEVTEHCDECDGSGEGPFDSEVATGLFEEVSWDYS
jgi:RecJ-like exonuclease